MYQEGYKKMKPVEISALGNKEEGEVAVFSSLSPVLHNIFRVVPQFIPCLWTDSI